MYAQRLPGQIETVTSEITEVQPSPGGWATDVHVEIGYRDSRNQDVFLAFQYLHFLASWSLLRRGSVYAAGLAGSPAALQKFLCTVKDDSQHRLRERST